MGEISRAKGAAKGAAKGDSIGREELRTRLTHAMTRGGGVSWSESEFESLALDIFRYQLSTNPVYEAYVAAYCVRARRADPHSISHWQEIPPVPTRAFKDFPDGVHGPGPFETVFRTSGTTASGRHGEHRVRDLALYHHSLLTTATAFLRPEGTAKKLRVLALLPSPEELPNSSLAHMVGFLRREWDDGGGGTFAGPDWSLRIDAWEDALRHARAEGVPALLIGTAFSFQAWLEARSDRRAPSLPDGSRIMETGGYKGRARATPKGELYRELSRATGIPTERIVAEYGMTEMLSQFYDPSLVSAHAGHPTTDDPMERVLVGPAWVRTRILDPITLGPVAPGAPGLLCHHDLANLDSAAAILTEDEGVETSGGLQLLGRVRGAEPRGCSLSMEDYLAAGRPR